ncbi:substrate-binding domain-containing protein [Celerinatantimonas diazotrophica]|uniref:Monosaccharide ABC transporter substrate-binding protein (CUT2 family) n=1 Tax=Celerinatantimonas diazotrophica TaxID=412034 RepID=A0A4R1K523_9GAMM|nr:substrate-binding domain-containing protein [Celerinatantimonas diazotrophica]TCK59050.1 monosaccharide ABC transporter substrate-binding protein (CUT2 family) [Celerinatantimonas diazotrophica]CAG9297685.1 hypothetical protein CEDIAZO_02874 [Celerinatantimonas diazotrophica]
MQIPYLAGIKKQLIITLYLVLLWSVSTASWARFIAVTANQNDTFRNIILSSIEQKADLQGDETYIDFAENDPIYQIEQIKLYMTQKPDALIVLPTSSDEQHNREILKLAGNIPVVFINVEPFTDLNKLPKNAVYVGSNELESGTMEMEELARLAGYKGKVALLIGKQTHPAAQKRTQDVKDVLAKYPNMTLVASQVANWSRNEAYSVTKKWLAEKLDFNILVANNDEMIIGAILAFQDAGIDPKPYLLGGIDATPDALQQMQEGNLDVTVLQDAKGQGSAALEVTDQLLQGQKLPPAHWVPFKLITPNNYQQLLSK